MAGEDFKRIVESLRVALALANPKGEVTFANDAFAKIVGIATGKIAGMQLDQLFAGEEQKRIAQAVARIGEGKGSSSVLEAKAAAGGKNAKWVQVSLQPLLDARDKPAGVIAMIDDIQAERDIEGELNSSAARLLALAEAAPQAAMIENARGEIELANEAFCRLLGLESASQSLLGLPAKDVLAKSTRVDAKAVDRLRRKGGETGEAPVKLEGGREGFLVRQPIIVDDAEAGILWTSREKNAVAAALERDASELALIEKIGEELSVALEGISAISIRAQQMEFDPALVEHFARIRASTETAMAAIADLVDFSESSGSLVLHKADFSLRSALAELIKRVAHDAEEHGCRLRLRVELDVSDHLEGDVERLQLVLKNLLDNAFQILPGCEITLHIAAEYVTEAGIQLSFSVAAGAEGGERPVPHVSAESGMGVAVAKFMVAAMGGKIAVGGNGSGSMYAFTIEFPVRPAIKPPARATYVSLVGMPVLFVSGDPEQRLAIANLLRGWRMVPLEADNAAMAIALLERLQEEAMPVPLVIVADQLAGQDGFLLAFRIKHNPALRSTLVMMLASRGKPGDAMTCRENGISAYMRYPIGDQQLHEAIMAVTGASVDSDETPTLVTRHSLREQRKGATILLVDPSRDSQILASHILAKRDCSVVVAQDVKEALTALEQDLYDMVLVDASLPGISGADTPGLLRAAMPREGEKVFLVASSLEHSPAWREARLAEGWNATLGKPFNKDHLLAALAATGRLPDEGG